MPRSEDDLGAVIAWAWENRIPLIPRGAGTGMPGGNLGPHVVVELGEAFGGVDGFDPEAGRIELGAGVPGGAADALVRRDGWFLPFLPSSGRWCRMGGMVANNAAGARSFRHGAVRSWVDSIEGFFAWGEAFRVGTGQPVPGPFDLLRRDLGRSLSASAEGAPVGWPRLRKNSSGYALDRFLPSGDPAQLLVGSEGTLAVITRVGLRLAPVPPETGLVVLSVESPARLTEVALAAERVGADTCEFLGRRFLEVARLADDPDVGALVPGAYALVLLEVTGTRDDVREGIERLRALGTGGVGASDPAMVDRLWCLRHAASPTIARQARHGLISTQFIEDSVVPPPNLGDYLEGLHDILAAADFDSIVFGHAGDGNVHVNPLVDVADPDWRPRVGWVLDEVAGLVASLGGTLAGEHGDGRLRAPLLDRIGPAPLVEAFDQVKATLDRRGILNPGVILPVAGQDPLGSLSPRPRSHPNE